MEMEMEFLRKLPTPQELKEQFPVSTEVVAVKAQRDEEIRNIFEGKDDRLILVIGPCSADNEDAVIDYMKPYFSNINTKNDALNILNLQKNNIGDLAKKIAIQNGYNYPVNVSIGNFYFPTKEYSEIILPEGYYDALKIELGNAKGQNWWCVMFPSLCIIDSNNLSFSESSEQLLQENLSEEELSIISNTNTTPDIKIKFKLIELFENL